MIVYYIQNLDESTAILEEDEFVHCIKVLRHKVGDIIQVADGKGVFAEAIIRSISKKTADLEILGKEYHKPSDTKLILAVAPPKSKNRWDFLLEKIVETGVDLIIPISTQNSERSRVNSERAKKIIRSAALQSKRAYHPVISETKSFKELIEEYEQKDATKLIAHYNEEHGHMMDLEIPHGSVLIIIGPEGDFSNQEYEMALQSNFVPVNISVYRLRTETAAIVSVNNLSTLTGLRS